MFSWRVRAGDRELSGDEKKLYTRVRRALWDYEPLRASHAELTIEVRGRSVHLVGRTRTLPQKLLAELFVRRLDGVDDVQNDLVADAEVIRAVADALAADPRTGPYVLQVDAINGVVTLRGEVPEASLKQVALDIASRAPLVAAVREQLAVGGPTYPAYALAPSTGREALPSGGISTSAAG